MVKRNIVIAIIIIVLFVVLALVGYGIVFLSSRARLARGGGDIEDDGD